MRVPAATFVLALLLTLASAGAARADAAGSPLAANAPLAAAYGFELSVDLPLMVASALIGSSWLLRNELPGPCAAGCDRTDLPAFDRSFAGRYEPDLRLASDLGVGLVLVGSGALLLAEGGLTELALGAEAVLVTSAFAVLTMYAVRRPRPLAYGEEVTRATRNDGSAALSFPSGHTANAFAATLALFHVMHARHPRSVAPWWLLGGGLALSSAVGVTRVLAGDHFPSDAVAGAALGTAIGWLVPELHRVAPGLSIAPSADLGLAISGRLP